MDGMSWKLFRHSPVNPAHDCTPPPTPEALVLGPEGVLEGLSSTGEQVDVAPPCMLQLR